MGGGEGAEPRVNGWAGRAGDRPVLVVVCSEQEIERVNARQEKHICPIIDARQRVAPAPESFLRHSWRRCEI